MRRFCRSQVRLVVFLSVLSTEVSESVLRVSGSGFGRVGFGFVGVGIRGEMCCGFLP